MLLDLSYRTRNGVMFQFARDHMTLALKPLALFLASAGKGIPFDQLSMGYSPGASLSASTSVLRDLQLEIINFLKTMPVDIFGYDNSLASRTRDALTAIQEQL